MSPTSRGLPHRPGGAGGGWWVCGGWVWLEGGLGGVGWLVMFGENVLIKNYCWWFIFQLFLNNFQKKIE